MTPAERRGAQKLIRELMICVSVTLSRRGDGKSYEHFAEVICTTSLGTNFVHFKSISADEIGPGS